MIVRRIDAEKGDPMNSQDEPTCEAIRWRRTLTRAIQTACSPTGDRETMFSHLPDDGSDRSLSVSFAILHGIVAEYLDGGDQIVELCDCGQHTDTTGKVISPSRKFLHPEEN